MTTSALLVTAIAAAWLSVPAAVLYAVHLRGPGGGNTGRLTSMLGMLLVGATILSLITVVTLLDGDGIGQLYPRVLAPAVVAAAAGIGGDRGTGEGRRHPRAYGGPTQPDGAVATDPGTRPLDAFHPSRRPVLPDTVRLVTDPARMVGFLLIVPALVAASELLS